MPDHWELLQASVEEAAWFADLSATLGHVVGAAAPRNRLRQVHVVEVDGKRWFLKEFEKTQWKNRVRARLTRPRCGSDGERERLVAAALVDRGFRVARPVAWGRHGAASYYLCAELPGASLRARIEARNLSREVALAAARFCGRILASGIQLTDLSAEHVFVQHDGFAVIDLHNGRVVAAPGKARHSGRTAVRILRRFVKSVRGLGVSRVTALGFACRLLKVAGFAAAERRSVVERVEPLDTHGRYEVPGRSRAYRRRSARRNAREFELLERVWPGRPNDVVLDSPGGSGRLSALLCGRLGARRIGVDRAMAMLLAGRETGDFVVQADAAELPLADSAVDGVLLFRFLHHLNEAAARVVLREAARVARRYVVVSFFHPVSTHGVTRWLKEKLLGRARTRHTVTHGKLRRWMAERGFVEARVAADLAFLRDFWVAAFIRK